MRPSHSLIPEAYENRPYLHRLYSGAREELKYLLGAQHAEPPNKFMIFAQGRTGSTLLTSTLNQHRDICCDDEILIVPRVFPLRFIELAARQVPARAYGFHVKVTQLHAWQGIHDIGGFLKGMQERGWKLIYLWRDNVLRQVVSNVFAEYSGTYHLRRVKTLPISIELPLKRLERDIELRLKLRHCERMALQDCNYIEFCYERDLVDPRKQIQTFNVIQRMIGVREKQLTPYLRRIVDKPLSEIISNYDEVFNWISQRPQFIKYLDIK